MDAHGYDTIISPWHKRESCCGAANRESVVGCNYLLGAGEADGGGAALGIHAGSDYCDEEEVKEEHCDDFVMISWEEVVEC
jgi:hypothetical protein